MLRNLPLRSLTKSIQRRCAEIDPHPRRPVADASLSEAETRMRTETPTRFAFCRYKGLRNSWQQHKDQSGQTARCYLTSYAAGNKINYSSNSDWQERLGSTAPDQLKNHV